MKSEYPPGEMSKIQKLNHLLNPITVILFSILTLIIGVLSS